MFYLSIIGLFV